MNKTRSYLCRLAILLSVSACNFDNGPIFTIVEGTVKNRYTGQAMGMVRVSVRRYLYGAFGATRSDSVTSVLTDAAGHYRLTFEPSDKGEYLALVKSTENLYCLNTPPGSDGLEARRGVVNQLNFEVTPYKTVTINANSRKDGKTDIEFFFIVWDQKGNDFRGSFFSDSVKTRQQVAFTRTVKLLPNRYYRFVKLTANRVRLNSGNVEFRDETWHDMYRTVLYNDTTVINFQ
ncbi:hypothetical protein MUN81_09240 [Hymenobacter sp. 5317J-9]|uniref:hypothetical protein n=1 Tax=Hymenobacter sp. 5317J-9 TaxID=2932250 RepID=UPI001FD6D64E|nr:hypothetical protein [Hymenobacter sp. 5317J-9]UOQ99662.1 hypothetical protein MUN81_09240 [Hymenobacter sp. 5317J-9]